MGVLGPKYISANTYGHTRGLAPVVVCTPGAKELVRVLLDEGRITALVCEDRPRTVLIETTAEWQGCVHNGVLLEW